MAGSIKHKPDPYKWGWVDAIAGRSCESPWDDFPRQSRYVAGYMYGKQLVKDKADERRNAPNS